MQRLAAIMLLATLLASSQASAQSEPPIRVAVSPFVYLTSTVEVPAESARTSLLDGMRRWVLAEPTEFELASMNAVRRQVKSSETYPTIVELGRVRAELGIEKYRELDPQAAADSLRTAREQYFRADHQFIDPAEVSETLLYLALALLDSKQGTPTEPIDVMQQMVLIDPSRRVQAGAFPDDVVAFYRSARLDLERRVREGGPGEMLPKRVASLTARRNVEGNIVGPTNYVLVGNVLPGSAGAVDVVVWLYDVEADQFQMPATITVRNPTPERLSDAANRLASRLLTCLVEPDEVEPQPIAPSSGSSPFALALNLAYASYFRFPTVGDTPVEPFDNLGAAIGGELFVTREFALVAMFQFLTSTTEFSGLVEAGFTTLRTFAGGDIGVEFGKFRLALGTLLEGTAVSRITTCPGQDFVNRRTCSSPEELPGRFLFGVNARPRLSFQLLESMQLFAGGSTSFYFLPLDAVSLNFLTTAEAGLQYRF